MQRRPASSYWLPLSASSGYRTPHTTHPPAGDTAHRWLNTIIYTAQTGLKDLTYSKEMVTHKPYSIDVAYRFKIAIKAKTVLMT